MSNYNNTIDATVLYNPVYNSKVSRDDAADNIETKIWDLQNSIDSDIEYLRYGANHFRLTSEAGDLAARSTMEYSTEDILNRIKNKKILLAKKILALNARYNDLCGVKFVRRFVDCNDYNHVKRIVRQWSVYMYNDVLENLDYLEKHYAT